MKTIMHITPHPGEDTNPEKVQVTLRDTPVVLVWDLSMYNPGTIPQIMLISHIISINRKGSKTMKITIRDICGDYALDLDYGCYATTIFFNSRKNALNVKKILEVDGSVPNQATVCDMKEVVRCKDCEYLMISAMYGECQRTCMGIGAPDDYCSRGKRKDVQSNV